MEYVYEATGHNHSSYDINDMENVFEEIYQTNRWRKGDGSGRGSIPSYAERWLAYVTKLMERSTSVDDFGCGSYTLYENFQWSIPYNGYDISQTAIDRAVGRCQQTDLCQFTKISHYSDLPGGDLLLVKEVLQHWTHEFRVEFLEWALDNYKTVVINGAPHCTIPPEFEDRLDSKEIYPYPKRDVKHDQWLGIWTFNNE